MAMKVRYTVMNGQVVSENRGGVKHDYLSDPLGNTTALLDNTGAKTDTFTYFPFGNVASRTGTTATPFQWVGGSGYYRDSSSRSYVRARTMYTSTGRWGMQDPIGFDAGDYNLYRYVGNRITTLGDPSGLVCLKIGGRCFDFWSNDCQKRPDCPQYKGPKPPPKRPGPPKYVPAPPPWSPPIGPPKIGPFPFAPNVPPPSSDPAKGGCLMFCYAFLCVGKLAYVCTPFCDKLCNKQCDTHSVAEVCHKELKGDRCKECCEKMLPSGAAQTFCFFGCKED